jgi:hypothetical protein
VADRLLSLAEGVEIAHLVRFCAVAQLLESYRGTPSALDCPTVPVVLRSHDLAIVD